MTIGDHAQLGGSANVTFTVDPPALLAMARAMLPAYDELEAAHRDLYAVVDTMSVEDMPAQNPAVRQAWVQWLTLAADQQAGLLNSTACTTTSFAKRVRGLIYAAEQYPATDADAAAQLRAAGEARAH